MRPLPFLSRGHLRPALLACLALLFGGPGPASADTPKKTVSLDVPANVELYRDLTYCNRNALKLHIARPRDGKGPFPAIVLIHGGGWILDGHREYLPLSLRLAAKGYVAVTLTYRLTDTAAFPAQVHDVKCAVRWLRGNAEKYQIDKERIGAYGHSSGGYLACMLGLTRGAREFEGDGSFPNQPSAVCCVVCSSGLTDLEHLHGACKGFYGGLTKMAVEKFLGGPPAGLKELYAQASPISYVCKGAPPTLLIYGSRDEFVPCQQSERLAQRLRAVGARVDVLALEGAPHDWSWSDAHGGRAEAEMLRFFDRHLKNPQTGR